MISLSIMWIENEVAKSIDFDDLMNEFTEKQVIKILRSIVTLH